MEKPKRLSLVRHANAEQDADVRDFERPLSRKGQSEALEMARRFQERGLIPDLILASAAVRTRETAETFARILGVATRLLQADDSLYLADGDHIIATIRGIGPRVGHLMVIGHNPGISAAAIALAPEAVTNDLRLRLSVLP
jgi:phosphohistidine phosphatase